MKNKIIFSFLTGVLTFLCFFNITNAQTGDLAQESISNFNSGIIVNTDNSVDVTEDITYNTGAQERHGMYRDIYPYSSTNMKMDIGNVSVADKNNNPYIFSVSNSGGNVRIKIGDPNQTFSGQKIYVIKYHATKAVAQYKDFDEIYWNATGNEWNIPIYQASATVFLPSGANILQSSCYFGPKGSKNQCPHENNSYNFTAPATLSAGDGLTVAVGFPKGVVSAYSNADKATNIFLTYFGWLIIILLPLLTLFFSLRHWYKNGRDPKGTGVIVPQYDVPDGLSPMEVVGIAGGKVRADNISSEIIYLATRGYLKISQTEEKVLGLFKSTDYELTKLKDFSDIANDFDKQLLGGLFESGAQSVKLSSLRNVFYTKTKSVVDSVLDALLSKGYYKNLGGMKNSNRLFLIIFMAVWASAIFGGLIGGLVFRTSPFLFILSIFISIIIYGIVSHFYPAKTEKGVATREYILGLKDYLQIAEKDRLIFHNAPDKKPEIFEKLLPFAMVLGVANIWAKEFEGIYTTPPSWYSGPNNTAFNAVMFTHSLSNFSSFASTSMNSSPSGSGSGGGGFSGGGGGGGGGGGW